MNNYIQGDTVWLKADFHNRVGQLYNPTAVKLKIYKDGREQVGATIEGVSITNVSTGLFEAAMFCHLATTAWCTSSQAPTLRGRRNSTGQG